ncbi:uncharacterized protein M6B38_144380 [Iris pallida]|uniref:Uncharacterized protein n=1 Tax=Iris pallida TaxID=29817 RepID=A0AAX6FBU5_IRIPA|nr:uncharacterized protein M6B38_144380 [Iris pallida]
MTLVLQNIRKVLKPNGRVLFRDYATGDLAQERLTCKEQQISENFYVRGDGTRAYYFTEDFLTSLFTENGFHALEVGVCNKQVENRSLELVMNRRWIQAVYSASLPNYSDLSTKLEEVNDHGTSKISTEDSRIHDQIDISDSIAQMFDVLPSNDVVTISHFWHVFNISNNQSASSPIRMGSVSGAWNSIDKVFVPSCQPSVKPLGSGANSWPRLAMSKTHLPRTQKASWRIAGPTILIM